MWKKKATGITAPKNPDGQNCYFCHYWTRRRRKEAKKPKKDGKKSRKHARREDCDEENSSEESGNDGDDNEDNEDNSDLFPEFDSAPSQSTCGQKQVYPGISFWIVTDALYSCISNIDTNIRQLFIKSGMEIDKMQANQPAWQEWKFRDVYTASLCQAIKDHKNQFAKDLPKDSAQDFSGISTEILREQIMHNYHANRDDVFPNNPEFGSKVVRITLYKSCPQQTAIDFTKALQEIRYAGISYDFVDKTTKEEDSESDSRAASLGTPATNKICSAVGLIERVMNDLDYRLHKGEVYRNVPQAKLTFVRSSSVNDFVHALLPIPKMAEVIAPQISYIISILSNSECQIIRQIELD